MALHKKEFKKKIFEQIMFAASFEYKYKITLFGRIYTPTPESTFKTTTHPLIRFALKISTPYCL